MKDIFTMLHDNPGFIRNVHDLPASFTLSTWLSGLVVELVAYTGPVLIVFQAAQNANLSHEQTASWLWAVTVGCGALCILISLLYRQPVITAWSTPGAALLVASLG